MHPYFFEKRPKNCYFHWSKKWSTFLFLWSNPSNTHSAPCILQHAWILYNDSYFPIYYKNSKFEVGLQDFLETIVQRSNFGLRLWAFCECCALVCVLGSGFYLVVVPDIFQLLFLWTRSGEALFAFLVDMFQNW
jgi:hypothetical protein